MLTIHKGEGCALKGCSVQKTWAHASLPDACHDAVGVWPVGRALPCMYQTSQSLGASEKESLQVYVSTWHIHWHIHHCSYKALRHLPNVMTRWMIQI